MGKITISWRNFKDSMEATEYDKKRSCIGKILSIFVNFTILFLTIAFFSAIKEFLNYKFWEKFFVAFLYLLIVSVIAYLMYVIYPIHTERGLELIFLKLNKHSMEEYETVGKQIIKKYNYNLKKTTQKYYLIFSIILVLLAIVFVVIYFIK